MDLATMSEATTYKSCILHSERISWTVAEVLPDGATLDFTRKLLPEALVDAGLLPFLGPADKLALNQIRGNSYLHLLRFFEEYIIAMTVEHASGQVYGDEDTLRALLRFAEEEAKHRELFKKFGQVFAEGFGTPCGVAGSAAEVADIVMQKSAMAVLLLTLHIELLTQHHFVASVKDESEEDLDPLFRSLLRHHWLEEAHHAQIDSLELEKWARYASPGARDRAVDEYIDLIASIDRLLLQQVNMDLLSLHAHTGRELQEPERLAFLHAQHGSYRFVFLLLGMTNRAFVRELLDFSPSGVAKVKKLAERYT